MRPFACGLLLVLLNLTSYCFGQARLFDAQHYHFEIQLTDESDTIKGKATISVKLVEPASKITLDFSTVKGNGKGMKVIGCTKDGKPVEYIANAKSETLELDWQELKPAGTTLNFTVEYKGIPEDGLIISKTMYGRRSFFADNWPDRGHKWLPCIDHPGDKATVEFLVTAPAHYRVVANGLLQEEKTIKDGIKLTHWKETVPIATKVMVIGVADFEVEMAGKVKDSIPVYSWVYPENKEKGFYDYGQAKEILPFFIEYAGPYGYKKLANVQSKTTFGGLENANTIFYTESSVTGTRRSESLLAHEIAHQWFGNIVTEKTFAHLWLSEGFATYMTILYMQSKYGKDTAVYMLKEDREQIIKSPATKNRSVVDETTNYMSLLNSNSYQKGSWILHMLRQQLGDDIFRNAVRSYYSQYMNRNADTRGLQKVFEKVSGKNLSVFFDQWLYSPGIPQLEVKWFNAMKTGKTVIEIRQLQDKGFEFPLTLKFTDTNGKTIVKSVDVVNRYTQVKFDLGGNMDKIELDPETALLFNGTVTRVLTK